MSNFIPNRVASGRHGAGRYDFKVHTESDLDLLDYYMEVADNDDPESFDLSKRVGLGKVSDSRSYLRAVNTIERAKTPEDIGAALAGLLRDRGEVRGFTGTELDLEKTREVAKTVADLFTKYPTITADIEIGECSLSSSAAEALGYRYNGEEAYFKKEMVINRKILKAESAMDAHFEKSRANGWHHVTNDDVTPVQYTVTHEFGHLIDYQSARSVSPYEVRKAYIDELGFANPYVQEAPHIEANTSRYAKKCREELLAEAFADVEMNGDAAFEYSKALHKTLVGEVK
jgi:hypothetical protein